MKFPQALRQVLQQTDEKNYLQQLEGLREEKGSWDKTAEAIGVSRSTLYGWRTGYTRAGRTRRTVPARSMLDRIQDAVRASPRAQLAAVDWKRLHIVGTITLGGGTYTRHENMWPGRYFSEDSVRGLGIAYAAEDDKLLQQAMDFAMSWDYIGDGKTTLDDVDTLDFGRR